MADLKTTAEIRAAPEAFKAACARATEAFRHIDGVVSVGYGLKQTAGQFGDEIAIVVFVDEKKPVEALAPAERIPDVFEGYRTDVRVVSFHRPGACDNNTKYSTIQGGIQIANAGEQVGNTIFRKNGTVACIVRRRNHSGRENVYLLSNAHVMYAKGHSAGDTIGHPNIQQGEGLGPIMDGGAFRNIVWPPGTPPPSPLPRPADPDNAENHPHETFLDCAIARLELDSCCGCTEDTRAYAESIIDIVAVTPPGAGRDDEVHGQNRIVDVRDVYGDVNFIGEVVTKVGRTSGLTRGRIVHVDRPIRMPNPLGSSPAEVHCYNCLEIIPEPRGTVTCGHAYFGQEGDSGSLVVDSKRRAVGLLFSVPVEGAPPDSSCGACFIVPVLDHLGICIPCVAPTAGHVYHHGASLATEGSGLAPIPLAPAQSTLTSQMVFLADGAAPALAPQAPLVFTPPMPVSEAHEQRMHALLEEFRATRLGAPLSAVINEVRREIGYLVRNVRPVKVAWGRHQGPAWLAHVLNHIRGYAPTVPCEVKGVTRRALLMTMREVLSVYGSNPLKRALAEYGDLVLEMLTFDGCDGVADVVAWIQEREREQEALPVEDVR